MTWSYRTSWAMLKDFLGRFFVLFLVGKVDFVGYSDFLVVVLGGEVDL